MLIAHRKLQPMQCYHIFSDSRDVYLSKNCCDNYSPRMVPVAGNAGSGSWPNSLDLIWNTSCSQDNTRKSCNDLFPVWSMMTWGFRVGGGVHDSYTFPCGLVGSFTFPGIDTR